MTLASHSPRGEQFLARQHVIVEACAQLWDAATVHVASATCPVDALFTRRGVVFRVAEVKARDLTVRALRQHGSYLVTFDKLLDGRTMAARLGADYVLAVGLDDALVWWPIADAAGEWVARFTTARTTTAATCNGGLITRANAYLSLDDMRIALVDTRGVV